MSQLRPGRLPLMALALLSLLGGMWWGLVRVGWRLPLGVDVGPLLHGPLMIGGFLGTLIGLERAVALGGRWPYAAPALSAAGTVLALASYPLPLGPLLVSAGSLAFLAVALAIVRRQPAAFTALLALGALCGLVGNLRWLTGAPMAGSVPWWMAFLVLTIAGERLELSRLVRLTRWRYAAMGGCVALLLAALPLSLIRQDLGMRVLGAALLALACWLGAYDIARRTVRRGGLTRYIAVALLAGYVWLAVGGALALAYGGVTAGLHYDALLHAVFVGFVVSMIFGHAPIVFPAVLGLRVGYSTAFYAHLALLHLSLALRVAGDLLGLFDLRRGGALLNAAAILLFFASTALMAWRAGRASRPTSDRAARPATPRGPRL